MSYFTVL